MRGCQGDDDGVVRNAQFIELGEHPADIFVVGHHDVVVFALPALTLVLLRAVSPEMHGGGVVPEKERLAFLVHLVDKRQGMVGGFVVDCLHALFR